MIFMKNKTEIYGKAAPFSKRRLLIFFCVFRKRKETAWMMDNWIWIQTRSIIFQIGLPHFLPRLFQVHLLIIRKGNCYDDVVKNAAKTWGKVMMIFFGMNCVLTLATKYLWVPTNKRRSYIIGFSHRNLILLIMCCYHYHTWEILYEIFLLTNIVTLLMFIVL